MQQVLVMPMHDPQGILRPLLARLTPELKAVFAGAVVGVAPGAAAPLPGDAFYRPVVLSPGLPIGRQLHALYRHAAQTCPPESALHLCFADRLAFQVGSAWRDPFFASMIELRPGALPRLFQRSPAAWDSHPRNYREIEAAVTTVGEWLFGRSLDYAWCHLAVPAARLGAVLPAARRGDMSLLAELVVALHEDIQTEAVDWLAWEDPFVLGRDPAELKREREASLAETRKRLSYALPMMEVLYAAAK